MKVHELIELLQDLRMPDAMVEVSATRDHEGNIVYEPISEVSYDESRGPVYIDAKPITAHCFCGKTMYHLGPWGDCLAAYNKQTSGHTDPHTLEDSYVTS